MMKKTFIDARVLIPRNPSGIGHYVRNIIKELDTLLDEPGYSNRSIYLIVPARAKKMISRDLDLRNIRFKRIFLPFRAINLLVRLNLFPPIDLILGKGVYVFPGFIKMPLLRSSSITFFYDLVYKKYPETLDTRMLSILQKKGEDSLRSDVVITISDSVAKELKALNQTVNNIEIISPSVDTTLFYKRSIEEIVSTKNKHHLTGAYILAVGNLEPRKNILTLVEAYRQLPEEVRSRYGLLIVGANSWKNDESTVAIKEANRDGFNIKQLIGEVNDHELATLYSGAALFVFPSLYEGYGMPVVEAMACGTPTIHGNDPAIVEAAAGAAYVVQDITSPQQLSAAIDLILRNKKTRRQLTDKGYARIEQGSDWRESAEKLYKILINLQIEDK